MRRADPIEEAQRALSALASMPLTPEHTELLEALHQEIPTLIAARGRERAAKEEAIRKALARVWPKANGKIRALVREYARGEWWAPLLPPEVTL